MAASDGQECDALPREATTLEDVGEPAPGEGRQMRNGSAFPSTQQQTLVQETCCQFRNFWRQQVSATVNHDASRDHLGIWIGLLLKSSRLSLLHGFPVLLRGNSSLERTFLGYLRTSLALAFFSVYIAQLFRLQHSSHPDQTLGFFVLAVPLAATCIIAAILVLLLGAFRFWRQQNAILRGKAHAGGWEVNMIGLIVLLVSLAVFVLVVAVNSRKTHLNEA